MAMIVWTPRELALDLLDVAGELPADDDDLGLGVVDDLGHLRRCQPPVDATR